MKILIIGDLHIEEKAIKEIDEIFENDIFPLSPKAMFPDIDKIIQLGDWFDSNRPTPLELRYSTELVMKLKQHYKEIVILSGTGEHDVLRGTSVIEHLSALGVDVIKGDLTYNDMLFGHWMLQESKLAFGTGKHSIKELAKYKYVFAGHQHIKEHIAPNFYHVGSIRAVSFAEVLDFKQVALLEDGKLSFIKLTSAIPMYDCVDIKNVDKLPVRSKIRYICKSFEEYRENASLLNKLGKKFVQFKLKLDFKDEAIKDINISKYEANTISKDEIIKSYLEKIEDKEVSKLLKEIINENN